VKGEKKAVSAFPGKLTVTLGANLPASVLNLPVLLKTFFYFWQYVPSANLSLMAIWKVLQGSGAVYVLML